MKIENNIINYAKIDENSEIIVPKTSIIGNSENILIRKEDNLTFSIYDLIEYKKILEKLKQESEMAALNDNIKRKKFFDAYIEELSSGILDIINKGLSNKVLITKKVKYMDDVEDRVILCDGLDHIKVFKNDENKKKYEKKIINNLK